MYKQTVNQHRLSYSCNTYCIQSNLSVTDMTASGRRNSRDRFSHVQSSGYGKRSPEVTPRKSHSPSLSPIRPAEHGKMVHASLDSARRSRKGLLLGLGCSVSWGCSEALGCCVWDSAPPVDQVWGLLCRSNCQHHGSSESNKTLQILYFPSPMLWASTLCKFGCAVQVLH